MVGAKVREPSIPGTNLRISIAASQGGRRYMEDRCLVHTERNPDKSLKWVFVGVFDGHGGEHASEFVRRNLLENIVSNRKFDSNNDDQVLQAIREGFLQTHNTMKDVHEEWPYTVSGYPSTAGTTVSCVFIRNGKLYTGHVGDSAIVLGAFGEQGIRAIPLTVDHKPESIRERARIEKAGGATAVKSGVTRVVWKRPVKGHQHGIIRRNTPTETIPFLSVARSLGDLWSYCESTNTYVVSPDPDIDVYDMGGREFCLILASDGLTNVMAAEQAVALVYKEEELIEVDSDLNRNHARALLRCGLQKWRSLRADNVTVATVMFDAEETDYRDSEVLMKLGPFSSVDQVLTDKPDGMLHVSNEEDVLLATQRTPIIYGGSKDVNFCRVSYRGPGFRTHEEELAEEQRSIITKKLPDGSLVRVSAEFENDDDIQYDDDDVELRIPYAEERAIKLRVENEVKMTSSSSSGRVLETRILVVPSPVRPSAPKPPQDAFSPSAANTSVFEPDEGTDEEDIEFSTPSKRSKKVSPSKTPGGTSVRRVKAEACRRLRAPQIPSLPSTSSTASTSCTFGTATVFTATPKSPAKSPVSSNSDERRVTRSVSRATNSIISPMKVLDLKKRKSNERKVPTTPSPVKLLNVTAIKSASRVKTSPVKPATKKEKEAVTTPVRRSERHVPSNSLIKKVPKTPRNLKTPKETEKKTHSRKRGRAEMMESDGDRRANRTGVTPAVAAMGFFEVEASRSAPSTPKKASTSSNGVKMSKWSLSKLDTPKPSTSMTRNVSADGIIRVSEMADEDDDDTMAEPPSKMRRIYGFMKRLVGWNGK